MTPLQAEVMDVLKDALMLSEVPAHFTANSPLFETFGLDSVDALEIVMALRRHFQIELTPEDERNRAIFTSVSTLADFVASKRA